MNTELNPVIRLDSQDNIVVARHDLEAGLAIPVENIVALTKIPAGFKLATRKIKKGDPVLKYNTVIGYAAEDILPGVMLHSHNIRFGEVNKDYAFCRGYKPTELLPESEHASFRGYVREDGRVGTRNYIGVMVVGNCGATVARRIADHFTLEILRDYPGVDGVTAFVTELGCGMEMTGEPMDLLRRTLSGYIRNGNTAASLVIALGCERNDLEVFFREQGLKESEALRKIVIQEQGGTRKSIEAGIREIEKMLPAANKVKRESVSAKHLVVGLQCGGSDSFSALSANPALGAAMDILVKNGGTAILSETPEIYGAEHTLTRRAASVEIGKKLVDRMNWWLKHTEGRDNQINGRVSPGNAAGGISNILEKSVGGVKKGGNTGLMEVYEYAQPVRAKGLVFMDTPGYDPVSATGQMAGGANLIAFTTGRGSCYGGIPAPCVKLATNTPMYKRMLEDMDVNCGRIIDGEKTIGEMGREIFKHLLRVASGEKTKSEILGVGEHEYVPWPLTVIA